DSNRHRVFGVKSPANHVIAMNLPNNNIGNELRITAPRNTRRQSLPGLPQANRGRHCCCQRRSENRRHARTRNAEAFEESARGGAVGAEGDRSRSLPRAEPLPARCRAPYFGYPGCRSAFADREATSRSHAAEWPKRLRKT